MSNPNYPQQTYTHQSYVPQQQQYEQPSAQSVQVTQQVKFYKSSRLGFASAIGRFERDSKKLLQEGWRVKRVDYLGINLWLQKTICVIWER